VFFCRPLARGVLTDVLDRAGALSLRIMSIENYDAYCRKGALLGTALFLLNLNYFIYYGKS
jgi:hypothetical protein